MSELFGAIGQVKSVYTLVEFLPVHQDGWVSDLRCVLRGLSALFQVPAPLRRCCTAVEPLGSSSRICTLTTAPAAWCRTFL